MVTRPATEQQVLDELQDLEPSRWFEVLDFIGYLKQQAAQKPAQPHFRPLTARELVQSDLVGLWADRDDIGDSLSFARRLREQAEHRQGNNDDTR